MLYHGAQRVKLPNLSKIARLLSPLAIFQAFQRYMISDVVFCWKVDSNFGHFAATLPRYWSSMCRHIVLMVGLHVM